MGNTIHGGDDTSIEEEDEIIIPEEDEDIDDTTSDDDAEDDSEDDADDDGDDEDLSPEELKAKLKKAKQIAENQKRRAEKAEAKLKLGKTSKKVIPSSKRESSDLSNSEMIAIIKADIAEEDIDDVRKYAKLNGISIKESLASGFMKTLLSQKAEERATAEAAHTGGTRKTASRKSGVQLLSDAQAGNMPDDPTALAQARLAAKVAKRDAQKKR